MNTKIKLQDKAQMRQMEQQKQRSKEPGEKPHKLHDDQKHEHERPEARLTR
jgi:hypothetical protein